MSMPFFSIVIPLYNKEKYILDTIKSIQNQTFQDFEIVVINDGSKDNSVNVVKSISDNRINLITQENSGVSVARNKGIKKSKANYIVFLDADDLWLPDFLQTIYDLIHDFPNAGLYATAYRKRKENGDESNINIQGLPLQNYRGLIPNYFKSIVEGENLVCSSATCVPKKVFVENDIWFPVGEKYGEDQYVWGRVAIKYNIAYDTKAYSIYKIEAENNTTKSIKEEKNPHQSILFLKAYMNDINDEYKLKYFKIYIEKHIKSFILKNIINNYKTYAFKQIFVYELPIKLKLKLLIILCIPLFMINYIKEKKI